MRDIGRSYEKNVTKLFCGNLLMVVHSISTMLTHFSFEVVILRPMTSIHLLVELTWVDFDL